MFVVDNAVKQLRYSTAGIMGETPGVSNRAGRGLYDGRGVCMMEEGFQQIQ